MKHLFFAFIISLFYVAGNAQSLQEGIKHLENENYQAALNTFNAVTKADPKAAGVYYYIGEVHYQMDNMSEAEKAYRKGLIVNTQCFECNIGLGKLELDKGNAAKAQEYFDIAIRINKKNPQTYALIGDSYLYSTKPVAAKAVEYLSTARDMDPKNAIYWAHLGDAFQLSGDNGEAMTAYETAVEKDPSNAEAYIRMARIWARAQQEELAIPKLEEAIRLSPNDARPIKDLYELYIQERQYSKVIPLLEKYISLIGTDVDAKVRLVKFLAFQAKDYDRAIEEGEKLMAANPNEYTLHRWLAWSYIGKAKMLEADKLAKENGADPQIMMLYEKALAHSTALFDAITKDAKKKAFPEDYDFWALATLKVGKIDDAAHIYRKYLEFEPTKAADIYSTLAKIYYDSANYVQAIAYYDRKNAEKALTNTEENYLGLAYYRNDQLTEADSSFTKVIRTTPTYAGAWWMRALIAERIDSTQSEGLAKPFYEEYIKLTSGEPDKYKRNLISAYLYLAVYHAKREEFEVAKTFYEKVLELDPANEKALGDMKILSGQ